jgi:hypothetical protein
VKSLPHTPVRKSAESSFSHRLAWINISSQFCVNCFDPILDACMAFMFGANSVAARL